MRHNKPVDFETIKKEYSKKKCTKKGPLLPEDAYLLLNPKEQFCNERIFLK